MKRRMLLLLVVVAAGAWMPVEAQTFSREASVRKVDSLWANSYATHDTTMALSIFDEALVMTSTDGRRKDRRAELRDIIATPGFTVVYFRSTDVNVRVLNGAAVVTGTLEWRIQTGAGMSDTRRRYTATYAEGGPQGWRMVALHVGRAPE